MSVTERFLGFALLGAEWVMWVLIVLSVISITVMVERVIYFYGQRPNVGDLLLELKQLLVGGDLDGVRKRLEDVKGVAPSVARVAMAEAERGATAVDEAAASAMIRERLRLERNLVFLGTVGNNAPFVGLFGTVIGIIQAFHDLSMDTQGGASTVMSGISEALVATAIGLMVAIPAVAAFNIFQRRIKTLLGDADAIVHVLLGGLAGAPSAEKS
jgi:biopolymer transport protein ExbB